MKIDAKVGIGIAIIAVIIVVAGNHTDQNKTTESITDSPIENSISSQTTQPSTSPMQTSEPSCDPSYPDFCIPPNSPDLNCGEISHKNFRVIGNDKHGFDRDNDGIGCES